MSSFQLAPAEILLDVFQANDPAATEALRLTCRRFNSIIVPKVEALPTRLVCDLEVDFGHKLHLYRAPANNESTLDGSCRDTREPIASGNASPHGLHRLFQLFGRKTSIREVKVSTHHHHDCEHLADAQLMQLLKHFPSVKSAVSLYIIYVSVLPTDAVLDHFKRLETIMMDTRIHYDDTSFWSVLFATKAFRRVSEFTILNASSSQYPEVDDGAMFEFITDFSLMPAGKPRLVDFAPFDDDSLDALEERFYKNIASIGGPVCALISDHEFEESYITNMAFGSRKETVARKLLRDG